jgi:hypothetical protein
MMKNLLIVFSVLALASTANATLSLTVTGGVLEGDGSYTIPVGGTLNIGINNDDASQLGLAAFIHPAPADLSLGGIDDLTLSTNVVNGNAGNLDMGTLNPGWAGIIQTDLSKPDPAYTVPLGDVVTLLEYNCYAEGIVTLTLMDSPIALAGATLDSITINQVPEPITFALLGLGGLFLRRRK